MPKTPAALSVSVVHHLEVDTLAPVDRGWRAGPGRVAASPIEVAGTVQEAHLAGVDRARLARQPAPATVSAP